MAEQEPNKQSEFVMEKIKERPINKRKLLKRTLTTASMAVIFGLIACLTFLILEPVFSNWLYPKEQPSPIIFPEEQDEMLPEDMMVEKDEENIQEAVESVITEDEQLEKIFENFRLDQESYVEIYDALSDYTEELDKSMVIVTGVTSDVNWMDATYEKSGSTYGVIVANNGQEYMILTDRSVVRQAKTIMVTFHEEVKVEAQVQLSDSRTNLAVIAVKEEDVPDWIREKIVIASLGSSNFRQAAGTPIVAMGYPMGSAESVGYGIISTNGMLVNKTDMNYHLFGTNIYGSTGGTGVVFNMQGKLVGVITMERYSADTRNMLSFIGISDLRKLIENMSNDKEAVYVGISAVDVTSQAHLEMGVPLGAYVREVSMNSPAMLAGIQKGDIIIEMEGENIEKFSDYTTLLDGMEIGQEVTLTLNRPVQNDYQEIKVTLTLEKMK